MSRSGFYDYLSRRAHPVIDVEEVTLLARVEAIAARTRESYGSRRMARVLQDEGFQVGRYKARRLMKDAGVSVRRRSTRKPQTTDSRHGYGVAPNVLDRQFDVTQPNVAWAGDLSYIWTQEGWLYLAVVLVLQRDFILTTEVVLPVVFDVREKPHDCALGGSARLPRPNRCRLPVWAIPPSATDAPAARSTC